MDSASLLTGLPDPAFAVDRKHRVIAWNQGAEALLGYRACSVLGKRCDRVICGTDVFGNRFCDADCQVLNMAQHHERVNPFELYVRTAASKSIRTTMSITVLDQDASKIAIVHRPKPLAGGTDTICGADLPGAQVTGRVLTRREMAVLRQLADGARTDEIAACLYISVVTVRNHIEAILRKLEVHSRLQAVSVARRLGII